MLQPRYVVVVFHKCTAAIRPRAQHPHRIIFPFRLDNRVFRGVAMAYRDGEVRIVSFGLGGLWFLYFYKICFAPGKDGDSRLPGVLGLLFAAIHWYRGDC